MKKKKQTKQLEENPFRSSETDPQGSYSGVPENPGEKPVQDADDL